MSPGPLAPEARIMPLDQTAIYCNNVACPMARQCQCAPSTQVRDSIVVSISACRAEDPGSIPGRGALSLRMQTHGSMAVSTRRKCACTLAARPQPAAPPRVPSDRRALRKRELEETKRRVAHPNVAPRRLVNSPPSTTHESNVATTARVLDRGTRLPLPPTPPPSLPHSTLPYTHQHRMHMRQAIALGDQCRVALARQSLQSNSQHGKHRKRAAPRRARVGTLAVLSVRSEKAACKQQRTH